MRWKRASFFCYSLLLLFCVPITSCSIDTHLQKAIKVEDPFATDDERQFTGLVVQYFALPEGESTFVRFPSGKTMLIDVGSAHDAKSLDTLLIDHGITKIDYVVLSNDQPAQTGGFADLAERFQLDTIFLPKLTAPSISRVVPLPRDKKLLLLSEGDQIPLDDQIAMTVIHPTEKLSLSPQDNSLVFQLKQGQLRFLFASAIGEKAEEQLLQNYSELLRAEVLKVADQGSNQASTQPFLSKVDPQVAIIETGKTLEQMKAGQAEVIERLGESWAETYITGQHGTITILSNGKNYRVIKEQDRKKQQSRTFHPTTGKDSEGGQE